MLLQVSLTIAWANLWSGLVATTLARLLPDARLSRRRAMLLGTLPYAFLHTTAIVPAFLYVLFTTTDLTPEKLALEDLRVFRDQDWLFSAGSLYCEWCSAGTD